MYLLIASATSWLVLLGSFWVTCATLPSPRTTTDLVVIALVGAATAAFTRMGLVSMLTLLLRLLPNGRLRSALSSAVVRAMPVVLRSSVLAAISATVAVQAAHAAPIDHSGYAPVPSSGGEQTASAPLRPHASAHPSAGLPAVGSPAVDPSWPTTPGDSSPEDGNDGDADSGPLDPGWPTAPVDPPESVTDGSDPRRSCPNSPTGPAENDSDGGDPSLPASVRVVSAGDSLWTIAADVADSPADIHDLVETIYADNRDVIGPDPNLIMPGQRLEILP